MVGEKLRRVKLLLNAIPAAPHCPSWLSWVRIGVGVNHSYSEGSTCFRNWELVRTRPGTCFGQVRMGDCCMGFGIFALETFKSAICSRQTPKAGLWVCTVLCTCSVSLPPLHVQSLRGSLFSLGYNLVAQMMDSQMELWSQIKWR